MAELPALDPEDVEDLEDAPDSEIEAAEEQIVDQATAARTIAELRAEIGTLQQLEGLALAVRRSGEDRKWRELSNLLTEIFTPAAVAATLAGTVEPSSESAGSALRSSPAQKLVIFTEHRDTLNYHRAEDLKHQKQAGKPNARLNSNEARRRADTLQARLQKRMEDLQLESMTSAAPKTRTSCSRRSTSSSPRASTRTISKRQGPSSTSCNSLQSAQTISQF